MKMIFLLFLMISFLLFIDPSYTLTSMIESQSIQTNVRVEGNFSHLTLSTTSPYNSLVAYYPFDGDKDNTKLTTHYDFTNNNLDGTGVGDALVNSSRCLYGDCLHLDGTGDYVSLGTPQALNFSGKTQITILAWIRRNECDNTATRYIYAKRGADYGQGSLRLSSNRTQILMKVASGNLLVQDNTNIPPCYKWIQVGATYNGSKVQMYMNGIAGTSSTAYSGAITGVSATSYIGALSTDVVKGSLDEVMIFNTSLTTAQVLAVYQNTSARFKPSGTQTLKQFNLSIDKDYAQITDFEEILFGSSIPKSLGKWNVTRGYKNSAPTDNIYLKLEVPQFATMSSSSFSASLDYSYSTWVKFTNLGASSSRFPIFGVGSGKCGYISPYYGFQVWQNSSKLYIENSLATCDSVSTSPLSANRWYNLIVTIDGSNDYYGNTTIYLDGVKKAQKKVNYDHVVANGLNMNYLWDGVGYSYSNISYDRVQTFTKVLTVSEVLLINSTGKNGVTNGTGATNQWDFQEEDGRNSMGTTSLSISAGAEYIVEHPSLMSYYHFDESSWTATAGDVKDAMGQNNGTAISGANTSIDSVYYRGGRFDGTNDYVKTYKKFDSPGLTFSTWFKVNSDATINTLMSFSNSSNLYPVIASWSQDYPIVYLSANCYRYLQSKSYADGRWHFIAVVINQSNKADCNKMFANSYYYLDGTYGSLATGGNGTPVTYFTGNYSLGGGYSGAWPLNGSMDEVMVFNKTLNSSQLKELYIKGRAKWTQDSFQTSDYFSDVKTYSNFLLNYNLTANTNKFYSPLLLVSQAQNLTVASSNNITSCIALNTANTVYYLKANITNNALTSNCITILASNITLNCLNNFIKSDDNYAGIYSNQLNTTIKNCNITMGTTGKGIQLLNSRFNLLQTNLIKGSSSVNGTGIHLTDVNQSTFTRNNLTNNYYNIYFTKSNYNLILNNNLSKATRDGSYLVGNSRFNNFTKNRYGGITVDAGIYQSGSSSSIIDRNNFTGDRYGTYFTSSASHNIITNNLYKSSVTTGAYSISSSNQTFLNNSFQQNVQAIFFSSTPDSLLNNNLIINCSTTSTSAGCITLSTNSHRNRIYNTRMESSKTHGIYMTGAKNNTFVNLSILYSTRNDTHLISSSINNTFLNATYSKEGLLTSSTLIRKWFYRAFVNDTDGNLINGANVTAFNKTGDKAFNLTTDATGYTKVKTIIDYTRTTAGKVYYSPYMIYASYPLRTSANHSYNVTLKLSQLKDVFTLDLLTPILSLLFDKVSPITYNQTINVTCTSNSGGIIKLFRDGTDVTAELGLNILLHVNTYLYKCNVTSDGNYKYAEEFKTLIVQLPSSGGTTEDECKSTKYKDCNKYEDCSIYGIC